VHGAVAQLGERLNGIQEADGSIPFSSTKDNMGLGDTGCLTPLSLRTTSLACFLPLLFTVWTYENREKIHSIFGRGVLIPDRACSVVRGLANGNGLTTGC
jgi:hypothetical protein